MANNTIDANNFTLVTDFNTSPYYDDYDQEKKFYRIIFKPGLAVQARELTQMQTMLQKQIDRFGEHIFKEGSIVLGGQASINQQRPYIKIRDKDFNNVDVNINNFVGTTITGASSGVKAYVERVASGLQAAANTKTFFIRYTASGSNNTAKLFLSGEKVTSNTGVSANVITSVSSVGNGYSIIINSGVIFAKDHFIAFDTQTVDVDRYSQTPTKKIGFTVEEEIVSSNDDSSLLDPASGAYNFAAPGADRLQLTPVLEVLDPSAVSKDFIQLYDIRDGVIFEKIETAQYSIIKDEWARRTYDESGNYTVRGLKAKIREHLNTGENNGLFTLENGGNTNLVAVGIEPGKAYVLGYDIEKLVTSYVPLRKGIDFKVAEQQSISANYGNYIIGKEFVGSWDINNGVTVKLYNTAKTRITSIAYSTASPAGAQIGTAKLKAVTHESGTMGRANTTYRVYLHDVQMSNAAFSAVRSLYFNNASNADMGCDVVLDGTAAVLLETNFNNGVFQVPIPHLRKIRDENDQVDTTFVFQKSFDVTVGTGGTFTASTGTADEVFPYSTGLLNSTQKQAGFIVSLNGTAAVTLTGNVAVTSGSNTVTGTGTSFLTQLKAGDKLIFNDTSEVREIASITNNSTLKLRTAAGATDASTGFKKRYESGDIIDFTINGSTNVARTINISSTTSAAFDMKETLDATVSATVMCHLNKTDAQEMAKQIKRSRLVQINCNTHSALASGPWSLGFPDIYQITSVRKKTGSNFASTSEGTDVTSSFTLDTGQRDSLYGLGALVKNGASVGTTDRLLVTLDYFLRDTSQGVGYFSVDSYPIDDVNGPANTNAILTKDIPIYISPTTGVRYNLRDCIDTRSGATATSADATTIGAMTTNPSSTVTISIPSGGLHTPVPNENFTVDLSYYLRRKDVVALNKNGEFRVVEGVPALLPITPITPSDSMKIATVEIAPYPSLPPKAAEDAERPEYANSIKEVGYKGYTMREIGVLDQRIKNLEYYVSLNTLEKDTLDLKILDANGLDRFKNGILVDPFVSHAIGDTNSPDYVCAIDKKKNELRPTYTVYDMSLAYSNTSTNVQYHNNGIVTLPYTHTELASQPHATKNRNTASLFYNFKGKITLVPDVDNWVDTTVAPDLLVTDDANYQAWTQLDQPWQTEYSSWQTVWTGTSSQSHSTSGGGTATTTTTTQNQTRTKTTQNVDYTVTQQSLGERVTDASLIPYMRPNLVRFTAVGMKPNTKLFAFFDSEDVSDYITPTNSSFVATGVEGSSLISGTDGIAYGLFRISNSSALRFTVGTKKFTLTDSIDNSTDPTTLAEADYTSQGLAQQKQETILSTGHVETSTSSVVETRTITSSSTRTSSPPQQTQHTVSDNQLSCCFTGETRIWMADGSFKRIEELVIGDKVKGRHTVNTISGIETPVVGNRLLYSINQSNPFFTGEHPFFALNKGWVAMQPNTTKSDHNMDVKLMELEDTLETLSGDEQILDLAFEENPEWADRLTYNLLLDGDHTYFANGYLVHNKAGDDPIAQTFLVAAGSDEGAFVTKLDLYFAGRHTSLGAWVELRTIDVLTGYITGSVVPYSRTYIARNDINVSTLGNVATTVTFPCPIFLQNNIEYAFVVIPEQNNPDTYLWAARLGEDDIQSGHRINEQPYIGVMFASSNNRVWEPIQDEDIKFTIYRASFSLTPGTLNIPSANYEYFTLANTSASWSNGGEDVYGEVRLTLSSVSGSIANTDTLVGNTSGATGSVGVVAGSVYRIKDVTIATKFTTGEVIKFKYANGSFTGATATIASQTTPHGQRDYYNVDSNNNIRLHLKNASGSFAVNEQLRGQSSNNLAYVGSHYRVPMNVADIEIAQLDFNRTDATWQVKTTDSATDSLGEFDLFNVNENTEFDTEQEVLGVTEEGTLLSGSKSFQVQGTLSTLVDTLSPFVDTNRTHAIFVSNIINNDETGEDGKSGGHALARYISQKVTLAEGQDAEDLQVFITGYQPPASDIAIYFKALHGEDANTFEDRSWIKMELTSRDTFSDASNKDDFKEYEYTMPASVLTGTNEEFQYINSAGVTFTGFKYFAIKIVLLSSSTSEIPRCKDFRVVAMQK
jgi:hypothetical protein